MKKFILWIVIVIAIMSCAGPTSEYQYAQTAKYKIAVNGPYNAFNGGQKWTYYCDSYTYDVSEHYILKKDSGEIIADFTKRVGDRIEILPNPYRR
jgi:hypothetical protein